MNMRRSTSEGAGAPRLKGRIGITLGTAFIALVAWAAWSLHFPPGHPGPPTYSAAQTPIDERAGVYLGANGAEWLVAPALDNGLLLHPISRWDASWRVDEARLRGPGVPDSGPLTRSASQPYRLEAISVAVPERLAGWSFRPTGEIKGGVVLVHGAGASDRDNGYYVFLAHQFASRGWWVVLPDKRGSGRSGGDWRNAPLDLLATDAAAWMTSLRDRLPQGAPVGFVGVSQGGMIAAESARLSDASFAIALSTSTGTLKAALSHEVRNDLRDGGAPAFIRPALAPLFVHRAMRKHPRFWTHNAEWSLMSAWRRWRGPLYIALGADDEFDNVPVNASVADLESLRASDGPTWKVYPDVGHGLTLPDGHWAPHLIDDIFGWLEAVTADPRARQRAPSRPACPPPPSAPWSPLVPEDPTCASP